MHSISNLIRRHKLAAAIAAIGVSSGTAIAQSEPAKTAPSDTIETVTVTAKKRTENARDVAASISVVGNQQLERQHVSSLVDLAGSLPGVQIETGGTPGQTTIAMRGISSLDVGSVVATYIDDSPLGSSSSFAVASRYQLDLLPYDIERIEVLRGPQGTLYGAGSMGGLLKYVMKEPDLNYFSGRVGGGVSAIRGAGSTGYDSRANINVPVVDGKLGFTASLSQHRTPGYIDNAVSGAQGTNQVDQKSGRVSVKWQPSDALGIKVSAMQQTIAADGVGVILLDPATQQPLYGRNKTGTVLPEPFRNRVDFYSAAVSWDWRWADFTSATSYSKTETHSSKDDTVVFGPVFEAYGFQDGRSALHLDLDLKKFTQEFRLASKPASSLEWLVGTFYTREASQNRQLLTAKAKDGTALPILDPLLSVDLPTTYREISVFGDMTYKLSDSFDLTGGLRWARNQQAYTYRIGGIGAALQGLTNSEGDAAESVATWLLSPRYHLSKDSMVYLRVATGYRAGSPNLALPGVPPTVGSDTLINYEAGWKSLFLDRRLSMNLALYKINWKDIQLNNSTPNGFAYLANGGTARSEGAEISLAYKPVRSVRLSLNGAYTDARLTADAPSLSGKDGDTLPGVARWNWSYAADYEFNLSDTMSGRIGGDVRWTGKRRSSLDSNPFSYRQASYGVLNLNGELSWNIWVLRAFARNLSDARPQLNIGYMRNGATGTVATLQAAMLQPRTIGIEVEARF